MTDTAENLPANSEKILAALLSEPTIKAAASKARVSEATVYRALRVEEFARLYREGRREITQHTIMRLQARSSDAAEILFKIANDKNAPASARVSAARAVVEQAFKAAELYDLNERIGEVEKTLATRDPKGGRR